MGKPNPYLHIKDVLQAADHLFSTQGYHSTTFNDIAKQLNVEKRVLHYYFRSKEEILKILLTWRIAALLATLSRLLASTLLPSQKISLMLSAILKMFTNKKGVSLSIMYDTRNLQLKDFFFNQLKEAVSPFLQKSILEGTKSHAFSVSHPVVATASLLRIIAYLSFVLCKKTDKDTLSIRLRFAETLIKKILGASKHPIKVAIPPFSALPATNVASRNAMTLTKQPSLMQKKSRLYRIARLTHGYAIPVSYTPILAWKTICTLLSETLATWNWECRRLGRITITLDGLWVQIYAYAPPALIKIPATLLKE